jgi:hypothetical protein
VFLKMLTKAKMENPIRIAPDILFTTPRESLLNLDRNSETPALRANHHKVEPSTTPATISAGEAEPPLELARPRPAKTAAKERIVIGFVMVKKTVEP